METPQSTGESRAPDRSGVASAPTGAITPDPVTAEIIRKHTAGQKLTPSEGGKLGAFRRKLKSVVGLGAAESAGQNPFAATAGGASLGGVAAVEATAGGLPAVPVDDGIARRAVVATLTKISIVEKRWLTREARAVGLGGNALADLVGAAGFTADDTQLIGDLAPDICAELGLDPRQSPLLVAGAILAAHGCSLLMAVTQLRELKEQEARRAAAAKPTEAPNAPRPADE